jgi:hypothetical protein
MDHQGPRLSAALVLAVSSPGEPSHIFNMNDFEPPRDPKQRQKDEIYGTVQHQTQPRNPRPLLPPFPHPKKEIPANLELES